MMQPGPVVDRRSALWQRMRRWAQKLKHDVLTVWLAARDIRTPRWLRWLALGVAAYALSPIDLIPDFIPVLGYLDDLLLLPLGIAIVLRFLRPDVLADCRVRAAALLERPTSRMAALAIVSVWMLFFCALAYLFTPLVSR